MTGTGFLQGQFNKFVDSLLARLDALLETNLGILNHLWVTVPWQSLDWNQSDSFIFLFRSLKNVKKRLHLQFRDKIITENGHVILLGFATLAEAIV